MNDKYTTISGPAQGLYKDRGSRFLAYAYPVSSEEEVAPLIKALEAEHHAARHHCYAFRLRGGLWRAGDDGEPSGTAGRPILGQIDSAGLVDVLVVVVRYFGGVLLGVPGLINAYRSAAADALSSSVRVEKTASVLRAFRFPYEQQPAVEKLVKNFNLSVKKRDFSEDCRLELEIPLSLDADFGEQMIKLSIFKDN